MREELIQRFFRKECTPEEATEVLKYLNSNREVLDVYLARSEWDGIQPDDSIPAEFWDELWLRIQQRRKGTAAMIRLRQVAVAASIIGVIILGFVAMEARINHQPKSLTTNKTIIAPGDDKTVIIRTANEKEKMLLPDSSIVELSKGATIKYSIPFDEKRDIELTGDAYFKVAKDTTKPFTVFAGGLSTTALGTAFRVTAIDGYSKIQVKLFEGEVVVRSTGNHMKGWNKDVYLNAGQQLKYDLRTTLVAVEKMRASEGNLVVDKKGKGNKQNNALEGRDIVFNSSTLPEVFEQLGKTFNTRISYNKEETRQMHFTATISKKDSLPIILKVIAQMNDLQIASSDSGFVVQKIVAIKEGEANND